MAVKAVIWSGAVLAGIHDAWKAPTLLAEQRIFSVILKEPELVGLEEYERLGFYVDVIPRTRARGDEHYFDRAFASLSRKAPAIGPKNCVYIGECHGDIIAAKKAGLHFAITLTGDYSPKNLPTLPEGNIISAAPFAPGWVHRLNRMLIAAEAGGTSAA